MSEGENKLRYPVVGLLDPEEPTSSTIPLITNEGQRPLNLLPLEKRVLNTGIPPLALLDDGSKGRWETAMKRSVFWLSAGFFAGLSRAWWNDVHEVKTKGWGTLKVTWRYFLKQMPRPIALIGVSGTVWSLSYAGIEEATGKKNLVVPGVLAGTVWGLASKNVPFPNKTGSAVFMSLAIVSMTALFQNKARENGHLLNFSKYYKYTEKMDLLPVFEDKPPLPKEPKGMIIGYYSDEFTEEDSPPKANSTPKL